MFLRGAERADTGDEIRGVQDVRLMLGRPWPDRLELVADRALTLHQFVIGL
jgi:hypothetical protein